MLTPKPPFGGSSVERKNTGEESQRGKGGGRGFPLKALSRGCRGVTCQMKKDVSGNLQGGIGKTE